ncbi:MAG: RsmG family class I SAM-dependent methyltransferase, partial [Ilumatobacter sp.]
GSGGGVPGLVIAHDRPDLRVILVDRRAKRTDFLERAVRRLRWNDRVSVLCADASALRSRIDDVSAVVARGFGPPREALSFGAGIVRSGGRIVISEPPSGDRWAVDAFVDLGVVRVDDGSGQVSIFARTGA